ncbi:hypothetical protein GGR50DRAFT_503550 [Xylaria sp. CBS 124048]|nr:hypothetical protein GGR50DRAFT_503550 [Xylaria sp. CBS 124048]
MDDTEEIDSAMAAAMGFSSFGTQPNKRRKFNPSADAFVATDPSSARHHSHQSGRRVMATTGSNLVPLGVRKRNTDEIDLDGGDEDANENLIAPTTQIVQPSATDDFDNNRKSQYFGGPHPSESLVAEPVDDIQSKIDAIIGSSGDAQASAPLSDPIIGDEQLGQGDHGESSRHARPDRREGSMWFDDYYDPSFVVNPWEALEKSKGLEPRGPWMTWEEAKAART